MKAHRPLIVLVLLLAPALLAPALAFAQDKPTSASPLPAALLPEWDSLTSAQRDELIAPLRQRWNANPDERARLFQRAQRWKNMPADARERAHHGMRRFEKLSPEGREHARALFHAMRGMDAEQRKTLLEQWRAMTPQQRNDWGKAHPAPERRRRQDHN